MKKIALMLAAVAMVGSAYAFDGKCCKGKKESCSKEKKEACAKDKGCCKKDKKSSEKETQTQTTPAPTK